MTWAPQGLPCGRRPGSLLQLPRLVRRIAGATDLAPGATNGHFDGISMGFLWELWDVNGISMGHFDGMSMGFLWDVMVMNRNLHHNNRIHMDLWWDIIGNSCINGEIELRTCHGIKNDEDGHLKMSWGYKQHYDSYDEFLLCKLCQSPMMFGMIHQNNETPDNVHWTWGVAQNCKLTILIWKIMINQCQLRGFGLMMFSKVPVLACKFHNFTSPPVLGQTDIVRFTSRLPHTQKYTPI